MRISKFKKINITSIRFHIISCKALNAVDKFSMLKMPDSFSSRNTVISQYPSATRFM